MEIGQLSDEQKVFILKKYGEEAVEYIGEIVNKLLLQSIFYANLHINNNYRNFKNYKIIQNTDDFTKIRDRVANNELPLRDQQLNYPLSIFFITAWENFINAIVSKDSEKQLSLGEVKKLYDINTSYPQKWFYETLPNASEHVLDFLDIDTLNNSHGIDIDKSNEVEEIIESTNIGLIFELCPNLVYE